MPAKRGKSCVQTSHAMSLAPYIGPFGRRSSAATPRFVSASYTKTAGFPPTSSPVPPEKPPSSRNALLSKTATREALRSTKASKPQRGNHQFQQKQANRSAGTTNFAKYKQTTAREPATSPKTSKPQRGKHQFQQKQANRSAGSTHEPKQMWKNA